MTKKTNEKPELTAEQAKEQKEDEELLTKLDALLKEYNRGLQPYLTVGEGGIAPRVRLTVVAEGEEDEKEA